MEKWTMLVFIDLMVSYGVPSPRDILIAAIMTRRAEALAFSRRVIPRTGKIHDHIPPRICGVLHDIFSYLARFYDS